MFEGFTERRIATGGAEIHAVVGGDGPPLALLHGYPQTHVMWHRVAPRLAEAFTVVAPDLRGYGRSSKPPGGEGSVNYAKRAMARDIVEVMAALGHDRFLLAGHDRGGRVAYRLALDHPTASSAWRPSTSCPPSSSSSAWTAGARWAPSTGSCSRSRRRCPSG